MRITGGHVIVCSPGRNFVTLKLETEDGVYGLGDATLNGRELAVASYLSRSRPAAARRPRRAAHRGHLAVPLQGRLLAARTGDDGGDRGGGYGAVGHQGQGARRAGVSAARRRVARGGAGLRPRQRRDDRRHRRRRWRATSQRGYKAVRAQCGVPGHASTSTAWPRAHAYEPAERGALLEDASGAASAICSSSRRCSSGCAASSVRTCTCCTTSIIG